ncbi:MAG: choice-of-anchor R domain-containing protein [Prosthecobacter sp.]
MRIATAFVTDDTASIVTGLSVLMQNADNIDHTVSAYLYSDTGGGAPSTLLATFTGDLLARSQQTMQGLFFSHTGIPLAANTRYWIAIAVNEDENYLSPTLSMTHSEAVDTGTFMLPTPPDSYYSPDSGSTWALREGESARFALEGIAVPEPGRTSLVLAGCLAVILRRCRVASARALSLRWEPSRMP